MQEIYAKSGKNAVGNEFQVHYWALNFRHQAEDNSILDIAIPTCYFNYEQFVTSAHIDFDLKEVGELSVKLLPIHNMKANELLNLGIQEKLEATYGVKFISMPTDFNSIHRHPGGSNHQSFSGTDLTKDANEPGVVFPLATASDNTPNFAGIMAIDSKECNVAHYEYRIANGTLGTDIEYIEGRCAAITVFPKKDTRSGVEALLYPVQSANKWKFKRCTSSDFPTAPVEELAEWLYIDNAFAPSTDAIDSEHVKTRAAVSYNYYGTGGNKATAAYTPHSYKVLDDMTLYTLNEHYKATCKELEGKAGLAYYTNKVKLITDIMEMQDQIVEEAKPKTRIKLQVMEIKELNTLYNKLSTSTVQVYLSKKETIINNIIKLQASQAATAAEEEKNAKVEITPIVVDTNFLSESTLAGLTRSALITHLNKMNVAYYGAGDANASWLSRDLTNETAPENVTMITDILAVQSWIKEELAEEIDDIIPTSIEDKDPQTMLELKSALLEFGADAKVVGNATYHQLKTWWDSLKAL